MDWGVMAMSEHVTVDANVIQALLAEIQGLRVEVAALRVELQALRPTSPPPTSIATTPAASPSAATWLQRPNAERLAAEVQRRQAVQGVGDDDGEVDTELDLLIDRLHDLALDNGG